MPCSPRALRERLRIRLPLLLAPMAAPAGTPALCAAVANAGGLGSLCGAELPPEALRAAICAVRALTDQPFAVHLHAPVPYVIDGDRIEYTRLLLAPYHDALGLAEPPEPMPPPSFEAQIEVLLDEGIEVASFAGGLPPDELLAPLLAAGVTVIGTATHLLEALVLEEAGVHIVVAQGAEAGGLRGGFAGAPERVALGTCALVPLLADHLSLPVVAAGGLMDGRGIAAALNLGASGVMLGTAFLGCPETGLSPACRERLLAATELDSINGRLWLGRCARQLDDRLQRELASEAGNLPVWPVQQQLTTALRHAAAAQDRPELQPLWAGQGIALLRAAPAAGLIAAWIDDAGRRLGQPLVQPPELPNPHVDDDGSEAVPAALPDPATGDDAGRDEPDGTEDTEDDPAGDLPDVGDAGSLQVLAAAPADELPEVIWHELPDPADEPAAAPCAPEPAAPEAGLPADAAADWSLPPVATASLDQLAAEAAPCEAERFDEVDRPAPLQLGASAPAPPATARPLAEAP